MNAIKKIIALFCVLCAFSLPTQVFAEELNQSKTSGSATVEFYYEAPKPTEPEEEPPMDNPHTDADAGALAGTGLLVIAASAATVSILWKKKKQYMS